MKLAGTIVVLVFLAASCQKEVIRPNQQSTSSELRNTSGDSGEEAPTGTDQGGIVDPNSDTDAGATGKKGK